MGDIILISENKLVYPEFKFFKSIYTTLNISNSIILIPDKNGKTFLMFSKDSQYYRLEGTLKASTEFFNWIQTIESTEISLSQINTLSKCLKKNVISIEYKNKEYFKFKYIEKDTNEEKEITFTNSVLCENPFLNIYNFTNEYELDESFTKSEICTVYRTEDNNLSIERTKDKLVELPSARIKSLIKNGKNKIKVSERDSKGNRFIQINSFSDELGLELRQIFKTI